MSIGSDSGQYISMHYGTYTYYYTGIERVVDILVTFFSPTLTLKY